MYCFQNKHTPAKKKIISKAVSASLHDLRLAVYTSHKMRSDVQSSKE